MNRFNGFTLLELLLTLALAALVLSLGVPSLDRIVAEHRLRTQGELIFHALHLARKESIARRRVVTLCASQDGAYCSGSKNWSEGWIMFVNRGRQREEQRDADEELLRSVRPPPQVSIMTNRRYFSMRSTELRATNGTIRLCDRADRAAARAIVISYTGRPRVSRETSGGEAIFCAD